MVKVSGSAVGPAKGSSNKAPSKTPATAKPASAPPAVANDAYVANVATPVAAIAAIGESVGVAAAKALGDGIASAFPLDNLGALKTVGRTAAGFRLDGGSLRLMWLSARRVNTVEDKPGFEISFFAQGDALERYAERLKKAGAKPKAMQFHKAEFEGPDGAAQLNRSGKGVTPGNNAQGLSLEVAGKYRVEMCTGKPEALKGALRITVLGTDKQATKALSKVINELGMQDAFAPPTPQTLERFKLMRMLWALAPHKIGQIGAKSLDDFDKKTLDQEATKAGASKANLDAVTQAKLTDPAVAKAAKQALLLFDTDPKAFAKYAAAASHTKHGILPHSAHSTDYEMTEALDGAGVGQGSDGYNKAMAADLDPIAAAKILRLGLIAKADQNHVATLLAKKLDEVSPQALRKVLNSAGVSNERIDAARFEEVYPGYFTVVDPALVKDAHDAGALYLYSTAPTAERVCEMLSGGQKSSYTRYQEGLLIEGMSSSADFDSGGAFSVFSRLVTKSAVKRAKKGLSSGKFEDWSGDRPFKLIINRRALGRLDWYAYNDDEFGSTKKLTANNRGRAIIESIEKNYDQCNEVMFPVGSAPSFIDFVVVSNDSERTKLIDAMEAQGFDGFNGKPLSKFVRVESGFFKY